MVHLYQACSNNRCCFQGQFVVQILLPPIVARLFAQHCMHARSIKGSPECPLMNFTIGRGGMIICCSVSASQRRSFVFDCSPPRTSLHVLILTASTPAPSAQFTPHQVTNLPKLHSTPSQCPPLPPRGYPHHPIHSDRSHPCFQYTVHPSPSDKTSHSIAHFRDKLYLFTTSPHML